MRLTSDRNAGARRFIDNRPAAIIADDLRAMPPQGVSTIDGHQLDEPQLIVHPPSRIIVRYAVQRVQADTREAVYRIAWIFSILPGALTFRGKFRTAPRVSRPHALPWLKLLYVGKLRDTWIRGEQHPNDPLGNPCLYAFQATMDDGSTHFSSAGRATWIEHGFTRFSSWMEKLP